MREIILQRPRRLRRTETLRAMCRETRIAPTQLIQPFFVCPGESIRREIDSMPGQFNLSIDMLVEKAEEAHEAGVSAAILFSLTVVNPPGSWLMVNLFAH